jgi:5-hydroxyisourate hydrolase-like protein (transthyretin family)/protocatechuate 3,4-dioxygenase beta subunit
MPQRHGYRALLHEQRPSHGKETLVQKALVILCAALLGAALIYLGLSLVGQDRDVRIQDEASPRSDEALEEERGKRRARRAKSVDAPRPSLSSVSVASGAKTVSVIVLAHDGAPVPQVEVELIRTVGSTSRQVVRGQTDESGCAAVRVAPEVLAADISSLRLRVRGLFREPVEKSIDPVALPREPITLTLPPHGQVRVRVLAVDNREIEGSVNLEIDGERMGGADGDDRRLSGRLVDDQRETVFMPVGLGLPLVAVIAPGADGYFLRQTQSGRSPGAHGKVSVIEFGITESTAVLFGRLLDTRGQPLREQRFQFFELSRTADDTHRRLHATATTGPEGRFRLRMREIDLKDVILAPPEIVDHRAEFCTIASSGESAPPARGSLVLPASCFPGTPGEFDLGDIRLQPEPIIVAGTIRDDAGAPVGSRALYLREAGTTWGAPYAKDMSPDRYWVRDLKEEGRFEIRGVLPAPPPSGHYEIRLSEERHRSEWQSFVLGQQNLELRVSTPTAIRGRLEFFADMIWQDLALVLFRRDLDPVVETKHKVAADGRFDVEDLAPGHYALGIRNVPGTLVILVESIHLKPGESHDLKVIALEPRLHRYEVIARDTKARVAPRTWVMVPADAQDKTKSGIAPRKNRHAVWFDPRLEIPILARAPGHRDAEITVRPGVTEIDLRGPIEFRVHCDLSGIRIPPGGRITLFSASAKPGPRLGAGLVRQNDGRFRGRALEPGLHKLDLWFHRDQEGQRPAQRVKLTTLTPLPVADLAQQEFSRPLSQEIEAQIQATIDRLSR